MKSGYQRGLQGTNNTGASLNLFADFEYTPKRTQTVYIYKGPIVHVHTPHRGDKEGMSVSLFCYVSLALPSQIRYQSHSVQDQNKQWY